MKTNNGFTLIELLIALAISSILLTAIYKVFISNNLIYLKQNELVKLEQELRSGINKITSEIKLAGYDPNNNNTIGINTSESNSSEIAFSYYDDEDEELKNVSFYVYHSNLYGHNTLGRKVNDGDPQPLIRNVNDIKFNINNCTVDVYLKVISEKDNLDLSSLNMNRTVYIRNECLNE